MLRTWNSHGSMCCSNCVGKSGLLLYISSLSIPFRNLHPLLSVRGAEVFRVEHPGVTELVLLHSVPFSASNPWPNGIPCHGCHELEIHHRCMERRVFKWMSIECQVHICITAPGLEVIEIRFHQTIAATSPCKVPLISSGPI